MSERTQICAGDAGAIGSLWDQAQALAWRDDDLPPSQAAMDWVEQQERETVEAMQGDAGGRRYGTLAFGVNRFGSKTGVPMWYMFGLPPHVVIRLKRMFPRISQTETQSFHFADTDESAADLLWFVQRYPMNISADDMNLLIAGSRAFAQRRDRLERIMLPSWSPDARAAGAPENYGFKEGFAPKPNQARAIEMALGAGRLLVADDVGLGKTETAIGIMASALHGRNLGPAAVVVEPHLATQWAERIARRSALTTHIIRGTMPYSLRYDADVYIFKYSNIAGWVDIAAKGVFPLVIYDEIQSLRGGEGTGKGRAAYTFSRHAQMRVGLSATPIYNYGGEIWKIMQAIEEGCLGSWEEFVREWCRIGGPHPIVKDPEALGTYLREKQLMIREVRSGAPVNTIIQHVDFDAAKEAEFTELLRQLAVRVTTGSFTERGQAARELDMMARQATGVAKARHVAAFVRMLGEQTGQPVMLAGWHREVYDIWLKDLADLKPVMFTGSETAAQKDKAKAAFRRGDARVFIISLRSGAGLDGLQEICSDVVIGELDWSPKVHEQVIGRLDRPGQTRPVNAYYCVTDDGADPAIMGVLGLKASQSHAIMNPGMELAAAHSDESRIKALAARYL